MPEFSFDAAIFSAVAVVAACIVAYAVGLAWSRGYHRGKREFVVGMMQDCTTRKEGAKDGEV